MDKRKLTKTAILLTVFVAGLLIGTFVIGCVNKPLIRHTSDTLKQSAETMKPNYILGLEVRAADPATTVGDFLREQNRTRINREELRLMLRTIDEHLATINLIEKLGEENGSD